MDPETTTSAGNVAHSGSRSKRAFVLHFLEMIIVMLVGMGVFSALAALAFGAAGSSLSDQSGAFRVMAMGFNMTVPMVLWMSIRGHSAPRNLEMAAAMLAVMLWRYDEYARPHRRHHG